uniref:Armadillo repeat-containing domain-containing protein n=1 Tax=Callorhinchus milii TaxID=7868 RepID=A0A4W3J4R1_CALMI|eukprot:gi/632947516/ref/XP_007889084.1/ PREDICTED: armadillo repeat-containing protein 10 [Callorhinchus milii]
MGGTEGSGWPLRLAAVLLLTGAGGLYALYQLLEARDKQRGGVREGPRVARGPGGTDARAGGDHTVHAPTGAASGRAGSVLANSPDNVDQQHLQVVLSLLQENSDVSTQERALVTLGNSAAFTVNQELIRNLGGLRVIGNCLFNPVTSVKVKTLNALNNLSMNVANQEELKVWIPQILQILETSILNSELQLAGLRVLTNMSVTNNYHCVITSSIPYFYKVLAEGVENTQVQVLKVLVNLSANPDLTQDLLCAQAPPSFLLLFDSCVNKDILLRVLTFVANLKENPSLLHNPAQEEYKVHCLDYVLFGNSSPFCQKLATLALHQDSEVKKQVARIVAKLP